MIMLKTFLDEAEIGGRYFPLIKDKFKDVSKQTFKNNLRKAIEPYTKGLFSDESWENINIIFNEFHDLEIAYTITATYYGNNEYDTTFPPERKRWKFEIVFVDNKNKQAKVYGQIIAAGAGTVEEPLKKYDIVMTLN